MFLLTMGETPKKKPTSPWSFAKDVVKHLSIVTPNSGRVDAAKSLSSNTDGISDGTHTIIVRYLSFSDPTFTSTTLPFEKGMPPYGAYNFIKCKYMGSMCNSYYLVL